MTGASQRWRQLQPRGTTLKAAHEDAEDTQRQELVRKMLTMRRETIS
ncbi:hypothetical protein LEMLEM_LOCUS19895, partial [Lemmus lemmus]